MTGHPSWVRSSPPVCQHWAAGNAADGSTKWYAPRVGIP